VDFFAAFDWDASPEIFQFGKLTVRWYGLLFALGFVMGYLLMQRIYRREGKPLVDLDVLLTWMVVATVVGARLGHCLFYEPERYLADPLSILKVWEGGLASHGGTLAILIAMWFYSRKRPSQPYLWLCDRLTIPIALAACFIRLGNFFNSEIVGHPSDVPWAVNFIRLRDGLPRHPAQLYESASYLIVFFILLALYGRWKERTPRGALAGTFLVLVFGVRFVIEFFKRRQAAWGEDSPLTVGQWLSIPIVALGLFLLVHAFRSRAQLASTES
jgi:phosphatidylglycerol---prolipoprotein diacylglyceryl transferase